MGTLFKNSSRTKSRRFLRIVIGSGCLFSELFFSADGSYEGLSTFL